MRAIKLNARVTRGHTLHLELPDDIEEGPAEVIVLVEGSEKASVGTKAGCLADFISRPPVDRRFELSKAKIDQVIRSERDSWD